MADLHDYDTNERIREATAEEAEESRQRLNGVFALSADGRVLREDETSRDDRRVYVMED